MGQNLISIGKSIKKLRQEAGITGAELGRQAGLSQSKISKIETGVYSKLKYAEIKKILNILNAPSDIRQQLLVKNDNAETLRQLQIRSFGLGLEGSAENNAMKEAKRSRSIKIYTAHCVPALLQTAEYRTASLKCKGCTDEALARMLKLTMVRQDILWGKGRKFHFIIPQTALYTYCGSKTVQLAQLDRLERSISIPSVNIGIIPVEAGLMLIENSSFCLYDARTLVQGLLRCEIVTRSDEDIALHAKLFDSLSGLARYDDHAIELIRQAAEFFS